MKFFCLLITSFILFANSVAAQQNPFSGGSVRITEESKISGKITTTKHRQLVSENSIRVIIGTGFNLRTGAASYILDYDNIVLNARYESGEFIASIPKGKYDVLIWSEGYVAHTHRNVVAPGKIPDTHLLYTISPGIGGPFTYSLSTQKR